MRMSKASDYALLLLANLNRGKEETWTSARKVGKELGIPTSFLGNITHKLVQAGILQSHRGAHGGVKLAKDPGAITVGAVLEAMHEGIGIVDCIEHPGDCPLENRCEIQRFWGVTHHLVLNVLKNITLKDITDYLKGLGQPGLKGLPTFKGEEDGNIT